MADKRWYVVHTYSGYENKVKANMEKRIESMEVSDLIFRIEVPTEEVTEVKNGKSKTYDRKIFPGYVLVQMIMDENSWYVVRNTPGVTGFVGPGSRPVPLEDHEVDNLLGEAKEAEPIIEVNFEIGEDVRIIGGPFAGQTATVNEVFAPRRRMKVRVSMFGRDTLMELDFDEVEKL